MEVEVEFLFSRRSFLDKIEFNLLRIRGLPLFLLSKLQYFKTTHVIRHDVGTEHGPLIAPGAGPRPGSLGSVGH